MSQSSSVFFLICVALLIKDFSDCCTDSELVRGCRLATSDVSGTFECLCGAGCEKEFPFKSRTECETVLKEGNIMNLGIDPCLSNPCLNRGECIQLRYGRYKCECAGTNFYGDRCQKECPSRLGANAFGISDESQQDFPLECIII